MINDYFTICNIDYYCINEYLFNQNFKAEIVKLFFQQLIIRKLLQIIFCCKMKWLSSKMCMIKLEMNKIIINFQGY